MHKTNSLLVPQIQVIIIRLSRNHQKYISFYHNENNIKYTYVRCYYLYNCNNKKQNVKEKKKEIYPKTPCCTQLHTTKRQEK